jgi:hypothetical protein
MSYEQIKTAIGYHTTLNAMKGFTGKKALTFPRSIKYFGMIFRTGCLAGPL